MSHQHEEKYADEERQEERGLFKAAPVIVEDASQSSLWKAMGRKPAGMQGLGNMAPSMGRPDDKMYGFPGMGTETWGLGPVKEPMKQDEPVQETWTQGRVQPPYQAPEVNVPSIETMSRWKVKVLKHPFGGYRTIKLVGVNNPQELAQVFHHLYTEKLFVGKMEPNTIFYKVIEHFRCRASFTHNFDTCKLELQAWEDPNDSEGPYMIEFIQKSIGGREAFSYLVSRVAAELKAMGKAMKYGNDREIFAPVQHKPAVADDPLQMPAPIGSSTPVHHSRLSVKDEQASNWGKILTLRTYPIFSETIRIIAKAVEEDSNLKVISTKKEVFEACCKELNEVLDPATVHNVLRITDKLVQVKLEESDENGLKEIVNQRLLLALTKTLAHNCGAKKVHKQKWMRSVAIEERAMALLWKLAANKDKFDNFADSKLQEVLERLERVNKQLTAQSHKCMIDLTENIRAMLAAC